MCIKWGTLLACYNHVEVILREAGRRESAICWKMTPYDGLTPREGEPGHMPVEQCVLPHPGCTVLHPQQLAFGYCGDCACALENAHGRIFGPVKWWEIRINNTVNGKFWIDTARRDEGQILLDEADARQGRISHAIREHGLRPDAQLY